LARVVRIGLLGLIGNCAFFALLRMAHLFFHGRMLFHFLGRSLGSGFGYCGLVDVCCVSVQYKSPAVSAVANEVGSFLSFSSVLNPVLIRAFRMLYLAPTGTMIN